MPKDEWGVKRVCTECGVRFYDLRKDPMTCPGCGAVISISNLTQSRPKPVEKAEPEPVEPVAAKAATDEEIVIDEDDPAADVDLDDDLLDDDDDDAVSLDGIADVPADDEV
ncbi:MAG: TIGR02300 family protein [Paracoccaceae bacterium]